MSIFEHIAPFFQQLYDKTGWNFIVFYDQHAFSIFVEGAWISLRLMFWTIILSLVVGVIGAWLQRVRVPGVTLLVNSFVEVFRNTPPIIQMLFFYFALGALTPQIDMGGYYKPMISAFTWAVISLGIFGGAFNIEIFRAGLDAVPTSTVEAAESLGFNKWQIYRRVTLPLALRISFSALTNNLISLAKWTSLGYVITVSEMTLTLKRIWSLYSNPAEMMILLFLFYFIVISLIAWILHLVERKIALPGYGE